MHETKRIARLLEQTFEGHAYYGPSVLKVLEDVSAEVAACVPPGAAHDIWTLVVHLTAELRHARALLEGTAGPWVEGETTWPSTPDRSAEAWRRALGDLVTANRALVRGIEQLDDSLLDTELAPVGSPYYIALHGTIQHNAYHAGQIALIKRQVALQR